MILDDDVLNFFTEFFTTLKDPASPRSQKDHKDVYISNLSKMKSCLGFTTEKKPSLLPTGGQGVFVTQGNVEAGTVVSMYPGKSCWTIVLEGEYQIHLYRNSGWN